MEKGLNVSLIPFFISCYAGKKNPSNFTRAVLNP